ncbi:MAG: hypothetical protein ACTSW1_11325, partial [Candidatus Hodarchaeales archaeon]
MQKRQLFTIVLIMLVISPVSLSIGSIIADIENENDSNTISDTDWVEVILPEEDRFIHYGEE